MNYEATYSNKKSPYALAGFASAFLIAGQAFAAGYSTTAISVDHRERSVPLHIYYPSTQGGNEIMLGKNAVFKGVPIRVEGSPDKGKFPIVLLSHGSGGNALNIGWIASYLADQGMIVVAPNHPGTTSGDSFQAKTLKLWERPKDMSAILDQIDTILPKGLEANSDQVGAIGFSLGGYTVMSLAGAKASKAKYIDYCDQFKGMMDCGWFAQANIDFDAIDPAPFEQSNADPRINAFVAIDPALAQAYKTPSLEAINNPVQIINLGTQGDTPAAVNASGFIDHLPNANYETLPGSTHFTFLGECTMLGKPIIFAAGEDPICTDPDGTVRAEEHTKMKTMISGFLKKELGQSLQN